MTANRAIHIYRDGRSLCGMAVSNTPETKRPTCRACLRIVERASRAERGAKTYISARIDPVVAMDLESFARLTEQTETAVIEEALRKFLEVRL